VILVLDAIAYSIRQIGKENGLPKSTIHDIIQRAIRNPYSPCRTAHRAGRPPIMKVQSKVYESQYVKATFKIGRSVVGTWACISPDFKGTMVILPKDARVDSTRYCNIVLNDHAYPFYEKLTHEKGRALWQDGGARYHTSKQTETYRKSLGMVRLVWPAQSPNLNPIENLWQIIEIRIGERRH
jgi:hypothetical protein